jgi:hypothetical protein
VIKKGSFTGFLCQTDGEVHLSKFMFSFLCFHYYVFLILIIQKKVNKHNLFQYTLFLSLNNFYVFN